MCLQLYLGSYRKYEGAELLRDKVLVTSAARDVLRHGQRHGQGDEEHGLTTSV